jgi:hypothetical protein
MVSIFFIEKQVQRMPFPESRAHPYKRDLKDGETYILDIGHFALEEDYDVIAEKISGFFSARPQIKAVNKDIKA